jgi:hypothetical protein
MVLAGKAVGKETFGPGPRFRLWRGRHEAEEQTLT